MEETGHALYNRVRAAEMQRRKQEQDVQRLFSDLESLTKDNEKRMKVLWRVRLYILLRYLSLNKSFRVFLLFYCLFFFSLCLFISISFLRSAMFFPLLFDQF